MDKNNGLKTYKEWAKLNCHKKKLKKKNTKKINIKNRRRMRYVQSSNEKKGEKNSRDFRHNRFANTRKFNILHMHIDRNGTAAVSLINVQGIDAKWFQCGYSQSFVAIRMVLYDLGDHIWQTCYIAFMALRKVSC